MTSTRRFAKLGHIRQFSLHHEFNGWVVREENDGLTVTVASSRNWSRVETRMAIFELKAAALAGSGWDEVTTRS